MAVPDRSTARRMLDDAGLPDGIVVHSEGVARVAVAAAGLVAEAQIPIDGALVEAAALLHDIDKVEIRRSGGEHGIVGARRLEAAGLRGARHAGRLPPGHRAARRRSLPASAGPRSWWPSPTGTWHRSS